MRKVWIAGALLTSLLLACSQSHRPRAEDVVDGDAPPAAEQPPQPPVSAGSAGRGEAPSVDVDAPPSSGEARDELADALLGRWSMLVATGRVYELRDWYEFEPGGALRNRLVNHGGSAGIAFGPVQAGKYQLRGRTLMTSVEIVEHDASMPGELPLPATQRGTRLETMSLAIGTRPDGDPRAGEIFLDGEALFGNDARRFHSKYRSEHLDANGARTSSSGVQLSFELSRSLRGLAPGSELDVLIDARIDTVSADVPEGDEDELRLEYRAVVRADSGWLRIVPAVADGLDANGTRAAVAKLLRDAGIAQRPAWAQELYERVLDPQQRYQRDDPTTLTSSAFDRWGWTRFDGSTVFTEAEQ